MTVKYLAQIETPTDYIMYLVDGIIRVPFDPSNTDYQNVQKWIAEGNEPEPAYTQEEIGRYETESRFDRFEQILADKATGLKRIAIDKPYMKNPRAIDAKYQVYGQLYNIAKKGLMGDSGDAVILKHEERAALAARWTILLNEVRSSIQVKIERGDPAVDQLLDAAEEVQLTESGLTDEKFEELKNIFCKDMI